MLEELKDKVSRFPDLPGVYLLKDRQDRIIYVGKAGSLRKRVRSYLTGKVDFSPRLRSLLNQLASIDYLVTDSEVEALILECSLIKEHRPRFNVNLKDDKDYPYLLITPELYPRLELLRLAQKSSRKARFEAYPGRSERRFGPYTDVGAVRDTMDFLGTLLPLRRCRQPLDGSPAAERPCLNYQIKRCLAPCRGDEAVGPEDYMQVVQQTALFLEGRLGELEKGLIRDMEAAAAAEQFERAAAIRDRCLALQQVTGQQQKMLFTGGRPDSDILALARLNIYAAVHLFMVRDGKLLSQKHFNLTGADDLDDAEVMASFIKSYYSRVEKPPPEIVSGTEPADAELISAWLGDKAGYRVKLRSPRWGSLHKLVNLAEKNALLKLEEEAETRSRRTEEPLAELGRLLGAEQPPERIEAYDISHLRGGAAVGAMVVFINGEAGKDEYRRFNIKKAAPGDDYAALAEVLQRMAAGAARGPQPDLLLIDGGRGQLSSAAEALHGGPLEKVPLAALAKDPDRLYLAGSSLPVMLPADNAALQLLQRIRNEAHRFAVSGHRALKGRSAIRSRLENIPGVGPAKRAALLAAFGSIEQVRLAGIEELCSVPGINRALAEKIYAAGRAGLK